MPEPIKTGQPLIIKTKTKTRTKVGVVALALFIGTGMMAGIGTLLSSGMVCNTGSRVGQSCRTNLDCRAKSTDQQARCIGVKTLPDLTARVFTIAEQVSSSGNLYVIGEIRNQGRGTALFSRSTEAQRTTIAGIEFLNAEGAVLSSGNIENGIGIESSITPGNRETIRWNLPGVPTGTTALRITADPGNLVAESDEANNSYSGNIRFPSSSSSTSALPDLVVNDGVTFSPDGMVSFQIANRGNAASPELPGTRGDNRGIYDAWLDADHEVVRSNVGTRQEGYLPLVSLSPGTISPSYGWGPPPSSARYIKIVVDPDRQVTESNEENNTFVIAVPSSSVSQVRFALSAASPSGASVPGVHEVLRFNVSASGGDLYLRNIRFGVTGEDFTGTRWPENDSFRRNWRIYDMIDLTTPIGTAIEVSPIRWSGAWPSVWMTEAAVGFGEPGLLIRSGTTKTFALRANTTGANTTTSTMSGDTVRFDVQVARWWAGSGDVHEEITPGGILVMGDRITY